MMKLLVSFVNPTSSDRILVVVGVAMMSSFSVEVVPQEVYEFLSSRVRLLNTGSLGLGIVR